MKIVVTGAAGLVGSNIVRSLLETGETITAMVHHDRRALEGLNVFSITGDVEDPGSLQRAFDGADAVVHAAGFVSIRRNEWDKLHRLNVLATRNVTRACLASGVKNWCIFPLFMPCNKNPWMCRSTRVEAWQRESDLPHMPALKRWLRSRFKKHLLKDCTQLSSVQLRSLDLMITIHLL